MGIKVNLTKRIDTAAGKRFVPVVQAANGRIKPNWVVIDGAEQRYPGGSYYLDWTEDGKRRRVSVGKSASQADARRLRKETELKAIEQGIELAPEGGDRRRKLGDAITLYLEEIKLSKKPKTFSAYSKALSYFQESCTKTFVEQVDRVDMLKYAAYLRDTKKQSPRSCYNKFETMMTFLKSQGVREIVRTEDWPRYVEEEPEVYEREELDKFFAACDDNERLLFEFFLMTGMREQEVMYSTWPDVNFKYSTVSMRWKPDYGWTPKAYKEREIPIPARLLTKLKDASTGKGLLFPNGGGSPNGHFHRICKNIAKRAGLDPEGWWLHKFRATFATWHLQAGVDLRTVQKWLGHTDLESTMRYLKAARGAEVQAKVNQTFA